MRHRCHQCLIAQNWYVVRMKSSVRLDSSLLPVETLRKNQDHRSREVVKKSMHLVNTTHTSER